ncbi:hypothetical protein HNR11_001376 [Nesterenkonia sandarakina]|uniref:Uncharacterized protein n=1 Tax=Nesterenkonia sandarakina TaxID=272918 RepID=A0A7Z0E856_9MICC|nr:hypothetical protein [Nesterenkonia sandarakina]
MTSVCRTRGGSAMRRRHRAEESPAEAQEGIDGALRFSER